MSWRSFKYLILVAPFALAACGEGYDKVRTSNMFPYGNQRTAGSTIAYVRASMMPERELNLKPVTRPQEVEPAPAVEPEEEVDLKPIEDAKEILEHIEKDMDRVFEEAQKK